MAVKALLSRGKDLPTLLVEYLNQLIFLVSSHFYPLRFLFLFPPQHLFALLIGFHGKDERQREIKACTYYSAQIKKESAWEGQVLLDL